MERYKGIWIVLCFILLVFSMNSVFATDSCEDSIDPNEACQIISPAGLSCTTITIYNQSGQKDVDGATMDEIAANSGVYNYTFNFNSEGGYSIVLCDNTTAILNVKNKTSTDSLFSYVDVLTTNQPVINANILATNDTIERSRSQIVLDISEINNTLREVNTTSYYGYHNWNYLTNSTLHADIWAYSSRTLTSFGIGVIRDFVEYQLNRTEIYFDDTDGYPHSWKFNYTNLGMEFNKTFEYNPSDVLKNITSLRIG